jgi:hypothetical protein
MVISVVLIYLIITVFEFIPLIKGKKLLEISIYSTLMIFSLVISILLIIGVEVPSIQNFIRKGILGT